MLNLEYDPNKWVELKTRPVNTAQIFITNKCNKRCRGCFNEHNLGKEELSFKRYKQLVTLYKDLGAEKIVLMGGEPTLHPDILKMIKYNNLLELKTTLYTNGKNIKNLYNLDPTELYSTSIRIGVLGLDIGEKTLNEIERVKFPVTIVYMLRRDNIHDLLEVASVTERDFINCTKFYISSIRDINETQDYWVDTKDTILNEQYAELVQSFLHAYSGRLDIHIAWRGTIQTDIHQQCATKKCRFINHFINDERVMCPLDISKKIYLKDSASFKFESRLCTKNESCLLTKIVLINKERI